MGDENRLLVKDPFWWLSWFWTSIWWVFWPMSITVSHPLVDGYHLWWLSPLMAITIGDYHEWWKWSDAEYHGWWVSTPSWGLPDNEYQWVMRIVFIRRLPWGMRITEWWLSQLMVIMADEKHWVMASSWQSSLITISDGWQCEYFMDIGWRVDGEWMESEWILCVWRVRELVNIGVLWPSSSFSYSLLGSHGSMVSVAPNLNVSWLHGLYDS